MFRHALLKFMVPAALLLGTSRHLPKIASRW